MLALLLICAHIIELAIYLGAGALAWRFLGWHPLLLVALGVLIAAGWRLILVMNMFLIAWLKRSGGPNQAHLGWPQTVWLVVGEYTAFMAYFLLLQPFDFVLRMIEGGAEAALRGGHGARFLGGFGKQKGSIIEQPCPVLFIHGFLCNAGVWRPVMASLRRRGYRQLFSINLEPPFGNINRFGRQVADCVQWICEETGAHRVVLVGHSMGGLAARAALREPGMPARVAKIVTLGTPHHGSWHANLLPGQNLQQMRPGSEWLAALNAMESPVPITSIYALHDNLVAPQDSAVLPNAKNIALAGVGHLALGFSPRVHALLRRELAVTM